MAYEYLATITNVVDGDTFDFEIDLGFGIKYANRLRLYGVDTPEIRGPEKVEGMKVKQHVIGLLFGEEVLLTTKKWKGKYGRYVCSVRFPYHGEMEDLATVLLNLNMAKKVDY